MRYGPKNTQALPVLTAEEIAKFEARVSKSPEWAPFGCSIWMGARTKPFKVRRRGHGYGVFKIKRDGKWLRFRAHRISKFLACGEDHPLLEIDHLCDQTLCVRPSHLEWVTSTENLRRNGERYWARVERLA